MITVLLLVGVVSGVMVFQDNALAQKNKSAGKIVKRGEYLMNYGGCHDCHSPKFLTDKGPEPDFARALSGHPAGTKLPEFPRNVIGPDKWGALTTNDDLKAIFAYLGTVPPIKNKVPDPLPPSE